MTSSLSLGFWKLRVSPTFITPSRTLLRVAKVEYGEEKGKKYQKMEKLPLPKRNIQSSMNSQMKSLYFKSRIGGLGIGKSQDQCGPARTSWHSGLSVL